MKTSSFINSTVLVFLLLLSKLALAETLLTLPSPFEDGKSYPLLVVLHGCNQTADEFRSVTEFDQLAQSHGFIVMYPEQKLIRNIKRCWNWFLPQNQSADGIETKEIMATIQAVKENYPIDSENVFVAGLSAGGSMAGLLAKCYPGEFRAAAIHSSPSPLRARGAMEALKLMKDGPAEFPRYEKICQHGTPLPIMVIHGTADDRVAPSNAPSVLEDLGTGDTRSRLVMVGGLGHEWSGGAPGHKYSAPNGPKANELIWRFFSRQMNR